VSAKLRVNSCWSWLSDGIFARNASAAFRSPFTSPAAWPTSTPASDALPLLTSSAARRRYSAIIGCLPFSRATVILFCWALTPLRIEMM